MPVVLQPELEISDGRRGVGYESSNFRLKGSRVRAFEYQLGIIGKLTSSLSTDGGEHCILR